MDELKIVKYPDERLKEICKDVAWDNKEIDWGELLHSMRLFLDKSSNGIGLAAPQVGYLYNMIIVKQNPSDRNSEIFVMYNPVIVFAKKKNHFSDESCLSLPGVSAHIRRSWIIKVSYQDLNFEHRTKFFKGKLAIIIQHEIGHLNGELFIDLLPETERKNVMKDYRG